MSIKTYLQLFSILALITYTIQSCEAGVNNCLVCDQWGNLCDQCSLNIYIPDDDGGCKNAEKCVASQNYCNECNFNEKLCSECELGYFPDENGGCSYTDNCEVSYRGECLKCKDNFFLVSSTKICKYSNIDDLRNCDVINTDTGFCDTCKDGYFLNAGDKKCTEIENCYESLYGVCQRCIDGYYLDKRQDLCKIQKYQFINCKLSLDALTCEECSDHYYFDENKERCISVNYCAISNSDYECTNCTKGYYLTSTGNICTKSQNCTYGNKDFGICTICASQNYLDKKEGICKYNQEPDKFKNCAVVSSDTCIKCVIGYYISDDDKCTITDNCASADNNSTCVACREHYFLGNDSLCSNIEHCLITDTSYNDTCALCEDGYYFHKTLEISECVLADEDFENCKNTDSQGNFCGACKKGYYLNMTDRKCYDNNNTDIFHKCAVTDYNGTVCEFCEEDYFMGSIDNICSNIEGCAILEPNMEKCSECDLYFCKNLTDGKCYDNNQYGFPTKKEELIYYNCNKTNEEGTECAECINDDYILKNGYCYNTADCEEMSGDECVKCKNPEFFIWGSLCINKDFGCVKSYAFNCLKCDNSTNFESCNQCVDGYELEDESCREIEEEE